MADMIFYLDLMDQYSTMKEHCNVLIRILNKLKKNQVNNKNLF